MCFQNASMKTSKFVCRRKLLCGFECSLLLPPEQNLHSQMQMQSNFYSSYLEFNAARICNGFYVKWNQSLILKSIPSMNKTSSWNASEMSKNKLFNIWKRSERNERCRSWEWCELEARTKMPITLKCRGRNWRHKLKINEHLLAKMLPLEIWIFGHSWT